MKYKKENIEKVKELLTIAICKEGLIVDGCQNILNHPEKVNLSVFDFAQILINTLYAPKEIMKEKNAYAYKMSELAAEQLFTQGYISEKPPIQRVK